MTTQQKQKYFTTPHGTKYYFLSDKGHVRAQVDFMVDLKRLLLFEEFCDTTDRLFPSLINEAIWEKMDSTIRNADIEQIGKYIKDQYLEK